jgi:hypothetical protein
MLTRADYCTVKAAPVGMGSGVTLELSWFSDKKNILVFIGTRWSSSDSTHQQPDFALFSDTPVALP